MQLEVTFRNLGPREEIRDRGQALYDKLERFLDLAADGQLVVAVERSEAICELVVTTRGKVFKSIERNADMRTAMDKVFHAMEEQLRRHKSRRTDFKVRGAERESGFVSPQVGDAAEADI